MSNSSASRSPSRRDRSHSPAPRAPSKEERSKSQTIHKRRRANSPIFLGSRRDRHFSPSPTWSQRPPRQERHRSPGRRCPDSRTSSHRHTTHLLCRGSRIYGRLGPRTPTPSNWAPRRTSKQSRATTPTSKRTKHRASDRVDILQVMEPRDGRSVWDTSMVEKFMNDHQRARTVLEYIVFQKELNPRRFQVAIKHRFPRDLIMTDAAIIFSGNIAGKLPQLKFKGHLTWPEWHAYCQDYIRIVTL